MKVFTFSLVIRQYISLRDSILESIFLLQTFIFYIYQIKKKINEFFHHPLTIWFRSSANSPKMWHNGAQLRHFVHSHPLYFIN